MALADTAAQRTGVPVAPALPYGVSPYFEAFPGTISLKLDTFLRVVTDLIGGLYRQGFRGLAVLNGHGGNIPAKERLSELVNELDGLRVFWYSWWRSEAVQAVAAEHERHPGHASWLEHFPFTEVADLPSGAAPVPTPSDRVWPAAEMRAQIEDGVTGGEYQSNEDLQHELFTAALKEVLAGLDSIKLDS
jgi:creatinine amidohydrolase